MGEALPPPSLESFLLSEGFIFSAHCVCATETKASLLFLPSPPPLVVVGRGRGRGEEEGSDDVRATAATTTGR